MNRKRVSRRDAQSGLKLYRGAKLLRRLNVCARSWNKNAKLVKRQNARVRLRLNICARH